MPDISTLSAPVPILGIGLTSQEKPGGTFRRQSAAQLAAMAAQQAILKAVPPSEIDGLFLGCAMNARERDVAALTGRILGLAAPACTLSMGRFSGAKALQMAFLELTSGNNRCLLAGSAESASQAPYLIPEARYGLRFGEAELLDTLLLDDVPWPYDGAAALLLGKPGAKGAIAHIAAIRQGWVQEDGPEQKPGQLLGQWLADLLEEKGWSSRQVDILGLTKGCPLPPLPSPRIHTSGSPCVCHVLAELVVLLQQEKTSRALVVASAGAGIVFANLVEIS